MLASDTDKQNVSDMLRHQIGLQNILHEHKEDMCLPLQQVAAFRNHVNALCLIYQGLAAAADKAGNPLWNQPTKWHILWHLGERAQYLNPRRANTMLDEDFVGKMKDITHACAAGTELHQMQVKALAKWRWGFDLIARFK